MKSRKRRYIQYTSEDDSDKENDELRLYLTVAQDEEKEVDYEILDRKYPIKEWKTEEDLNAVYQLVMDKYQDEMPKGFDRVLWGDLMVLFNSDDKDEFWSSQIDWKIVSWKLHSSSGVHTLVTDTEFEEGNTMAFRLVIKFVKMILAEVRIREVMIGRIEKGLCDTKLPQTSVPQDLGADEVVHKEGVTVWKGLSLLWQSQVTRNHGGTPAQTRSERVLEKPNEPPLSEGHTSGRGYIPGSDEGRLKLQELMTMCTIDQKQVLDWRKRRCQAVEISDYEMSQVTKIHYLNLEAFSDSDYAGASLDRKSTTGGCQFLGRRLISWQCKKQTIVANSTTKADGRPEWKGMPYVLLSSSARQCNVNRTNPWQLNESFPQGTNSERELVRIKIDDGNAFWNEIGVNAGDSKLMLLGIHLLLPVLVNAVRHKLTTVG
ncbi:hypothetical protein Tco_0290920 [Tanacetum coccineum]